MCIKFIDDLGQPLFHKIAMISLNRKKKSNICVLVLKVYITFTYVHVYVLVCYVVVYQVGEGVPISTRALLVVHINEINKT